MSDGANESRKRRFVKTPSVITEKVSSRYKRVEPTDSDGRASQADERRSEEREQKACQGRLTIDGQRYRVQLTQFSEHGVCCLPLPYWVKKGDPILLDVDCRKLVGRIAWRRKLSADGDDVQVGIRFSSAHPDLLDEAYWPPES